MTPLCSVSRSPITWRLSPENNMGIFIRSTGGGAGEGGGAGYEDHVWAAKNALFWHFSLEKQIFQQFLNKT
jgi:hypothetical protein